MRPRSLFTRRQMFQASAAAAAAAVAAFSTGGLAQEREPARLRSRPRPASRSLAAGSHRLGLEPGRDGMLILPTGYDPRRAAPLVIMLHGAGGSADRMIRMLGSLDAFGVIALVPESRSGGSWDIIAGGSFGPDVAFLDRALDHTFDTCNVDPKRIAVGGFSDGASYALMMGLANGDLFSHVLSFSPGFFAPVTRHGKPRIFISHGTADAVLNIDRTSRRIVPILRETGYAVNYREFDGPHRVPPEIEREAFEWFAG